MKANKPDNLAKGIEEVLNFILGASANGDWNKSTKRKATQQISQLLSEQVLEGQQKTRKECSEVVRTHLLTDWSGEAEVLEQLEQIAVKIDELQSKKGKS